MVALFLAEGFEETEALVTVDLLRRAGLVVQTVGVSGKTVTGAHGIPVIADCTANDWAPGTSLQAVVLPGGPGTVHLKKSAAVKQALQYAQKNRLVIAAICAAPTVLAQEGLLESKRAVCYPGCEAEMRGAVLCSDPVCADGSIITARGAGVTVQFACAVIRALCSAKTADKLLEGIQWVR